MEDAIEDGRIWVIEYEGNCVLRIPRRYRGSRIAFRIVIPWNRVTRAALDRKYLSGDVPASRDVGSLVS